MNKKGFTLIELLAVIVVLGIISLIILVSVSPVLSSSKDSLSNIQKEKLEDIAEIYYLKEGMSLGVTCVNISTLSQKEYIDSSEVLDPKTRDPLPGSVLINSTSSGVSYTYQDNACS